MGRGVVCKTLRKLAHRAGVVEDTGGFVPLPADNIRRARAVRKHARVPLVRRGRHGEPTVVVRVIARFSARGRTKGRVVRGPVEPPVRRRGPQDLGVRCRRPDGGRNRKELREVAIGGNVLVEDLIAMRAVFVGIALVVPVGGAIALVAFQLPRDEGLVADAPDRHVGSRGRDPVRDVLQRLICVVAVAAVVGRNVREHRGLKKHIRIQIVAHPVHERLPAQRHELVALGDDVVHPVVAPVVALDIRRTIPDHRDTRIGQHRLAQYQVVVLAPVCDVHAIDVVIDVASLLRATVHGQRGRIRTARQETHRQTYCCVSDKSHDHSSRRVFIAQQPGQH